MNTLRGLAAVVAASAVFSIPAHALTIDLGANLPAGPVPAGYAGFNWGTGANRAIDSGPDAAIYYLTGPAASIVQFGRGALFDLNSVEYQVLVSGETGDGNIDAYTTVVSGYRGSTLVGSITENYGGGGPDLFSGLNLDGVNKVTFSTTDTYGYLNGSGQEVITAVNAPSQTFVDQLKVSRYSATAPEMGANSAPAALTLLIGSLLVLCGRRKRDR
jgi:hypothetical protein